MMGAQKVLVVGSFDCFGFIVLRRSARVSEFPTESWCKRQLMKWKQRSSFSRLTISRVVKKRSPSLAGYSSAVPERERASSAIGEGRSVGNKVSHHSLRQNDLLCVHESVRWRNASS